MCYKIEILQQVIDHTYEGNVDEVLAHIQHCPSCKEQFETLKKQEMMVENVLNAGIEIPSAPPIHMIHHGSKNKRRIFKMNRFARRWTAVAAVVVICTGTLFVDPIRAKAQDLLKIFRMKEITSVSISEADLREIGNVFEEGNGSTEIENFIKIDVSSDEDGVELDNVRSGEEIKEKIQKAKVIMTDDFEYDYASLHPKQEVRIKLDVEKANEFLSYLGEENRLPKTIHQKPFTLHFDDMVNYRIEKIVDGERKYLHVSQMKAPTVEMPSDIDEKELIQSLFSMNFLPSNLKKQFMNIDSITSTIPIPYNSDEQIKEEITVRGEKAIVIKEKDSNYNHVNIFFKEGDLLYAINSNLDLDKILPLIEEMK